MKDINLQKDVEKRSSTSLSGRLTLSAACQELLLLCRNGTVQKQKPGFAFSNARLFLFLCASFTPNIPYETKYREKARQGTIKNV